MRLARSRCRGMFSLGCSTTSIASTTRSSTRCVQHERWAALQDTDGNTVGRVRIAGEVDPDEGWLITPLDLVADRYHQRRVRRDHDSINAVAAQPLHSEPSGPTVPFGPNHGVVRKIWDASLGRFCAGVRKPDHANGPEFSGNRVAWSQWDDWGVSIDSY
jgi:hypothetical protein